MKWKKIAALAALSALQICFSAIAENSVGNAEGNSLEIQSVFISDKQIPISSAGKVNLGPFPKKISFYFGPSNASRAPIRLRYKMAGYDGGWHQVSGEMTLTVRFYNEAGD